MSFYNNYNYCLNMNMNKIDNFDYSQQGIYTEDCKSIMKSMLERNLHLIRGIYTYISEKDKNKAEIVGNLFIQDIRNTLDKFQDSETYLIRLNNSCDVYTKLVPKYRDGEIL